MVMVTVMGGSTQLCYHCHEVTERTSDGDRVACSVCGRPYSVTPSDRDDAADSRSADLTPHDWTCQAAERHVRAFSKYDGLHKYAGDAGYPAVDAHDGRDGGE